MYQSLWLSPDGNAGGGATPAAGTGTAPVIPQDNPAAPITPTAGTTPTVFTQDQVDKIVGDRAKRAEESAVAGLLKTLGVENQDALKVLVEAARKAEVDKLSEAQKAQKRIEDLEASVKQAKADAQTAMDAANEKLLKSQVQLTAQSLGFVDPSDAILYIDKTKVKVDDAGNFSGIEEMLKEIAKAKPHLVKPTAGGVIGAQPAPHGAPKSPPEPANEDEAKEFAAVYGVNAKYVPTKKG